MNVKELLALTGQQHKKGFEYDEVISIQVKTKGEKEDSFSIGAIGIKDDFIMDIGVLPEFRRKGIGRLLVDLTNCDYTSGVSEEAIRFWKGIGWFDIGDKMIVDTWVKQFKRPWKGE